MIVIGPVSSDLGEPYFSHLIEERKNAGKKALEEAVRLIGEGVEITQKVISLAHCPVLVAE